MKRSRVDVQTKLLVVDGEHVLDELEHLVGVTHLVEAGLAIPRGKQTQLNQTLSQTRGLLLAVRYLNRDEFQEIADDSLLHQGYYMGFRIQVQV